MRTTLITLILAMASAVAAAQTTEGAREPADGRSWFDDLADFWGYAPVEEVREREAAVEEREAAVEKHAARLRTHETAVGRREAAVSQREEDVISGLRRLRQREAAVSRLEEDATLKKDEGVRIAWASVILGGGLGAWSLWKRTRRCGASSGGTRANPTRHSFGGWRKRRGWRHRRGRIWLVSTGPGRTRRRRTRSGSRLDCGFLSYSVRGSVPRAQFAGPALHAGFVVRNGQPAFPPFRRAADGVIWSTRLFRPVLLSVVEQCLSREFFRRVVEAGEEKIPRLALS